LERRSLRVGLGWDVHPLVEGRPLVLGGVRIPYEKGLFGHSDADVLIHALCDALLGAASLGDLGTLFPPSDPRLEGISSVYLLQEVMEEVRKRGWEVISVDSVIIAQGPRLAPHVGEMKQKLAPILGISPEDISIKPKSPEGLGFMGRDEGIGAMVVVLLMRP